MNIHTFGNTESNIVLVQPVDNRELQMIPTEISLIKERTERDFCLLACEVDNWNRDLSPWEADAVFGNEPFGGKAEETLAFLKREVLKVHEGKQPVIGGYSLAGLFALWAAYQTDAFRGVAAVSPSAWFPGFVRYAETHEIRTNSVYLSLGDKEEKTKNPVMKTVGDSIRALNELYEQNQSLKTTLEWNQGNHFKEPELRMAKAFAWTIEKYDRGDYDS